MPELSFQFVHSIYERLPLRFDVFEVCLRHEMVHSTRYHIHNLVIVHGEVPSDVVTWRVCS